MNSFPFSTGEPLHKTNSFIDTITKESSFLHSVNLTARFSLTCFLAEEESPTRRYLSFPRNATGKDHAVENASVGVQLGRNCRELGFEN